MNLCSAIIVAVLSATGSHYDALAGHYESSGVNYSCSRQQQLVTVVATVTVPSEHRPLLLTVPSQHRPLYSTDTRSPHSVETRCPLQHGDRSSEAPLGHLDGHEVVGYFKLSRGHGQSALQITPVRQLHSKGDTHKMVQTNILRRSLV